MEAEEECKRGKRWQMFQWREKHKTNVCSLLMSTYAIASSSLAPAPFAPRERRKWFFIFAIWYDAVAAPCYSLSLSSFVESAVWIHIESTSVTWIMHCQCSNMQFFLSFLVSHQDNANAAIQTLRSSSRPSCERKKSFWSNKFSAVVGFFLISVSSIVFISVLSEQQKGTKWKDFHSIFYASLGLWEMIFGMRISSYSSS